MFILMILADFIKSVFKLKPQPTNQPVATPTFWVVFFWKAPRLDSQQKLMEWVFVAEKKPVGLSSASWKSWNNNYQKIHLKIQVIQRALFIPYLEVT